MYAVDVNIDANCEGWRCPSCRNLSKFVPTVYRCHCGKCVNPRRRAKGELTVPHSCGELCKKKLGTTPESSCRYMYMYVYKCTQLSCTNQGWYSESMVAMSAESHRKKLYSSEINFVRGLFTNVLEWG